MTTPEKKTVSVPKAAEILGISRLSAYKLANKGDLPGVMRLGRRFVVSIAALNRALDPEGDHDSKKEDSQATGTE